MKHIELVAIAFGMRSCCCGVRSSSGGLLGASMRQLCRKTMGKASEHLPPIRDRFLDK